MILSLGGLAGDLGFALMMLFYFVTPLYVFGHITLGVALARIVPALRARYQWTKFVLPIVLTGTGWMTIYIEDDWIAIQAIGSAILGFIGLIATRNTDTRSKRMKELTTPKS